MVIRIIALLWIFITVLEASYHYKKIIVASFPTQASADKALEEIENTLYDNDTILTLQSRHHFDVISRASGKYFIVTIEPFNDSSVLQQVLDEVRLIKKDAFVNRFISDTDLFAAYEYTPRVEPPKISQPQQSVIETNSPQTEVVPQHLPKRQESAVKKEVEAPASFETTHTVIEAPLTQQEQHSNMVSASSSSCYRPEGSILYIGGALIVLLWIYMYFHLTRRIAKLRCENIELQQLMRHKDEAFAKNIHELRTPIHGIIGMTHLLKESGVSELYTTPIEKISKASERMLQLINDFLDFSKLEAKKIEIEHIEFDLNDVLESLSDNIGIEANKKGLDFLYQVESSLPKKYIGDPLRISQVLLNLISNAIKFTPEGGVYLTIKEHERDDTFITLEFEVEDSGIGLTQDQIESAFALFSQTDSATSRLYGGSGLGLAISKELVELMGGSIRCQKAQSGGARFVFTIKLQMYNPNEQRIYRLPSKSMMFKRAIIIDTNAQSIEFLTLKLEYFHYNVVTLASLSEVAKKETHFDLLFLDETHFNERSVSYLNSIKASYAVKIILVETLYNKIKNSKIPFEFDHKLIKPFSQQRIVDMVVDLYSSTPVITNNSSNVEVTLKEQLLQLPHATILLAEDNEINQKVILGLLKKTPIEVIVANNGEEAVALAKQHHNISLIFMDLSMPVMDGYTATVQIKQIPQYEEVPIVALSANVMSEEMEKILSVGMEEYLPKPFEMNTFYKLLLRYLS